MKNTFQKILLALILVIGSLTFSGCSDWFKDRGDPIVIDVNTPTGVTIVIPGNQSILEVGDALQLDANVAPDTAVQTVTWSSNNTLAAIVDANGLVTAMGAGRVKITATSTVNTEISGYAYLTVVIPPVVVTGIAISGSETVHVDETIKLNYALTPAEATATVTWSVDNQAIATIDENGRLTGVSRNGFRNGLNGQSNIRFFECYRFAKSRNANRNNHHGTIRSGSRTKHPLGHFGASARKHQFRGLVFIRPDGCGH